jgi:di/tricarboxylate transporter
MLLVLVLVLVAGIDEALAFGAYGDPIMALFIGSFLLAKAMQLSRLGARMAGSFWRGLGPAGLRVGCSSAWARRPTSSS